MKQLDIIRHAKDYLLRLNEKNDPISGRTLPYDSLARREDLRHFFYISAQILDKIILQDGGEQRPAFSLTEEQRKKIRFPGSVVSCYQFAAAVNDQIPVSFTRLSATVVQDWLAEQGLLDADKAPTQQGKALGILIKDTQTKTGKPCRTVLLRGQILALLLEHLDDLAASATQHRRPDRKPVFRVKNPEFLENLRRVMECLGQGADPTTGEPIPASDPLAQERLKRCFAFTAMLLDRVIKRGSFTVKAPFTLPRELWNQIPVSSEGRTSQQIANNINTLISDPTGVRPLTGSTLTGFAAARGLVSEAPGPDGKVTRCPTAEGQTMGIHRGELVDKTGNHFMTLLYGQSAQKYFVEHMAELIDFCARQD